jgi:uncharacterized protein YndB with AHSA1/START domain
MSMSEKPQHPTIVLERTYPAPLERVFPEFADPVARARWSPPSNDVLIYDQTDFRAGGRDLFRCGPQNDPKFRGEVLYHLIVLISVSFQVKPWMQMVSVSPSQ